MVPLDATEIGVQVQLAGPGQDSALKRMGRNQTKSGRGRCMTEEAPVLEKQATKPQNHAFPFQRGGKDGSGLRTRQGCRQKIQVPIGIDCQGVGHRLAQNAEKAKRPTLGSGARQPGRQDPKRHTTFGCLGTETDAHKGM